MATLLTSKVGDICIGRTCASSGADKTARLGACSAGTGSQKTAVGFCASAGNSGAYNTAFGYKALVSSTSAYNTAIGSCSLLDGGGCNTAAGHCSLSGITSGANNTGIGAYSLGAVSTGSHNVGLGYCSGKLSSTGNCNIFVGACSQKITTQGNCSVAIGFESSVCGGANIAIGCGACACGSDALVIGNGAQINGACIRWGASVNNVCNCVFANWSTFSDARDKTDIIDLSDNLGINLIRRLKPVQYRNDNRQSYVQECGFDFGTRDGTLKVPTKNYGFIAQEVKESADELGVVLDLIHHDVHKDAFSLTYDELISSIVKTIQTIDARIKVIKSKI